ncbi:hypothetical protein AVEN_83301-1 [Araneus ventricosus]|uniref:Uncharacterized protein n=1 Tax=Araneus ventricosus TaxID=182803 RepID=A0A4Y2SC68_ARAVE|nr:hypothetical protein AVEN_83301-1 [Araneus ventricosus]
MLRLKCFLIASPLLKRLEAPKSNLILYYQLRIICTMLSLVWVEVHAGNTGNELADHFTKIASSCGADMSIPAPYPYVKRVCKEFLMNERNSYWKNSTTGKRTKEIIPSAKSGLID